MYGLRLRRYSLLRLTLAGWVVAVFVMAFQGCVLEPERDLATAHDLSIATQQTQHTSSCLEHSSNAATAISSLPHTPGLDTLSWASLLLVPALVLLIAREAFGFPALVLRHPVPSRPPARLIFVRFND